MKLTRKLFDGGYLLMGEVGGRPLYLTLLVGTDRTILLDSGCASDVEKLILPALKEIDVSPKKLTYLINTHCDIDHQGGNHGMKKVAPQLFLACGDADMEEIESPNAIYRKRYNAYHNEHDISYDSKTRKWIMDELGKDQAVDLTFCGGEHIRLSKDWEVEVLHLPGHSHGHLGILDYKHRTLFGGDAIHGSVYLDLKGKPTFCPTYLHVDAYLQTIRFIQHLPIETYVGCHWAIKKGKEIEDFCVESRRFVEQADELILHAIQADKKDKTLTQLCQELGSKLGDWPAGVNTELCYAFAGHLESLRSRGLIQKNSDKKPVTYRSL